MPELWDNWNTYYRDKIPLINVPYSLRLVLSNQVFIWFLSSQFAFIENLVFYITYYEIKDGWRGNGGVGVSQYGVDSGQPNSSSRRVLSNMATMADCQNTNWANKCDILINMILWSTFMEKSLFLWVRLNKRHTPAMIKQETLPQCRWNTCIVLLSHFSIWSALHGLKHVVLNHEGLKPHGLKPQVSIEEITSGHGGQLWPAGLSTEGVGDLTARLPVWLLRPSGDPVGGGGVEGGWRAL